MVHQSRACGTGDHQCATRSGAGHHRRGITPEFPTITPHDLRHTAASLAVSAGANVKVVQRMLGHKSATMTLDIYAGLFDDDLESVATKLDEARAGSLLKMCSREGQTGG